jgi:hypothetical protein
MKEYTREIDYHDVTEVIGAPSLGIKSFLSLPTFVPICHTTITPSSPPE